MKHGADKDTRDSIAGRAVSAAVKEQAAAGRCLSDEQMAALLDKHLASGERERCLAHIAACDTCLAHYSLAAGIVKSVPSEKGSCGKKTIYTGAVIAAMLLIAIGLIFQQPERNSVTQSAWQGGGHLSGNEASSHLNEQIKNWSAKTLLAITEKKYGDIRLDVPAQLLKDAEKLGDTAKMDRLAPLVRHIEASKDSEEWYVELERLVKGL